jgi:hypothetical protein
LHPPGVGFAASNSRPHLLRRRTSGDFDSERKEIRSAIGSPLGVTRGGDRHNASVRIERSRENVFTVTATSQELSALVAGARMALAAMRAAPEPPPAEAVEILERVLREFDHARERLAGGEPGGG